MSLEQLKNREFFTSEIYEQKMTPILINKIITSITDLKRKDINLNIEETLFEVMNDIFHKKTVEEKTQFIKTLMEKSSMKEDLNATLKSLSNNVDTPIYKIIKFKANKVIDLLIEQGYVLNETEKKHIVEKGLYEKLNQKLISNFDFKTDKDSIIPLIKKELKKLTQQHSSTLNYINNLFSINKNKQEILDYFYEERELDFYLPYYITEANFKNKDKEYSTMVECIKKNNIKGILSLLDNGFILNLKEYALLSINIFSARGVDENTPENIEIQKLMIKKLNTYPLEYKKEFVINIGKQVNFTNKNHIDILFDLKDIVVDGISILTEREKFELSSFQNLETAPIYLYFLKNKEDKSFFLKLFDFPEEHFNKLILFYVYNLTKNKTPNKKIYEELFDSMINNFSREEKQYIIELLHIELKNQSKKEDNIGIVMSILEKNLLLNNMDTEVNHKDISRTIKNKRI